MLGPLRCGLRNGRRKFRIRSREVLKICR